MNNNGSLPTNRAPVVLNYYRMSQKKSGVASIAESQYNDNDFEKFNQVMQQLNDWSIFSGNFMIKELSLFHSGFSR